MRVIINRQALLAIPELIKWKLSAAVAFSSMTGYILCAGNADSGLLFVVAGVFLLASGSAALNQFTERKTDALMDRTMKRPLPSGKMKATSAVIIAAVLLLSGSMLLAINGPAPLFLGVLNVIVYNGIYTGLKKITTLAILPGALVGAVPPLIGYTAAGGAVTDTGILLFALFMFLWQLPHFWILLVKYGHEYEKAGIKTIYDTMTDRQIGRLVFLWILASSLLLWILTSILMPFKTSAGLLLLGLNITFIVLFYRALFRYGREKGLKNAFILINSFSLLVMIILIALS